MNWTVVNNGAVLKRMQSVMKMGITSSIFTESKDDKDHDNEDDNDVEDNDSDSDGDRKQRVLYILRKPASTHPSDIMVHVFFC